MWRFVKNLFSYMWFVFFLNWFQPVSIIIDVGILSWAFFNWKEVASKNSLLLISLGVFINFIWQVFNVFGHFSFLKREDPKEPIRTMLKKGDDKPKDFSRIKVEQDLINNQEFSYEINTELGVLENPDIVKLLFNTQKSIIPDLCKKKLKAPREYIKLHKHTLLKFLNRRWYTVSLSGGQFTNDKKICFASEIIPKENESYKWRVTKGYYYEGYLTNFIYTQYVGGGKNYKLFPPVNMETDPIKSLGDSDFSNHIGVSTLLYTKDGFIYVLRQAANAGYNEYKYMPTGSGSMNYADFKNGEDLRQMVIKGAERELVEESSHKKLLKKKGFVNLLETRVIGYYRDMERGGKPEFCCVSYINKTKEDVNMYICPDNDEIEDGSEIPFGLSNKKKWEEDILPSASLSLKMNYKFLEEAIISAGKENELKV